MPRVVVTEQAARGLEQCRRFLAEKNQRSAERAGQAIEQRFGLLETNPDICRPLPELPELRELVIGFGDSGYVALYRHDSTGEVAHVLAFRHQKEAGYQA